MTNAHEKTPFLKMAYITIKDSSSRSFLDYDFFFILDGTIRVLKDGDTYFLGKFDVFLFEPGISYQISSAGNNVVLSLVMDARFVQKGRSMQTGYFVCNSSADPSRDYQPLRQLLAMAAHTYFGSKDILGLNLTSHAYRLLYYLNAYHYEAYMEKRLELENPKYQERMAAILSYIHENYASSISLQEAADALHLSAPYLSSFFKQNMHENFNTYVNQVRLKHAVEDLIYTDKSITSITFDNGFASMNAMNRVFREVYSTTPNRYRQEKLAERAFLSTPEENRVNELPPESYQQLLEAYGSPDHALIHNIQFPSQEVFTVSDMHSVTPVTPIWKLMINVGPLKDLLKRDIEKQLEQVQEIMSFTYGRIEKVMDYSLFGARKDHFVFMDFDRAVNILQTHNMIPYLELSIPTELLEFSDRGTIIIDHDQYLALLETMLARSANMYGPDEMDTWYFEINPHRMIQEGYLEPAGSFVPRFVSAWKLIRRILPHARVGGLLLAGDLPDSHTQELLALLRHTEVTPDFLSIGIFPYEKLPVSSGPEAEDTMSANGLFYTRDRSYALHRIQAFRRSLSSFLPQLPPIHVSWLAADVLYGHYLNDTCFQSAFFFHNTVDLIGEVDMLGYFQMSDIPTMDDSNGAFLCGRSGLFNRYGIRKPGCLLLSLFSKCRSNLVQKGEDFVVLKGSVDRYMIGMCNYTYLNEYDSYSLHSSIPAEDAYKVYESPQTKNIEVKLEKMTEGTYNVILYQINRKHGSVFDEWARNGYPDRFSKDDLDYLRSTIQPLRTLYQKSTAGGAMEFRFHLEPHEVVFLVLMRQW
ncbi:MAG: helix-turn-helix domain-containing protein [Lachnospiraceae bacterium]|nr:helix-turn-helix domain-containing protein [Lachnospiraceae bacterium]